VMAIEECLSISERILGLTLRERGVTWRGDRSTRVSGGGGRELIPPRNTATLPRSNADDQESAASIAFTVWSPMLGKKCE
jgi:hypothetical protein